MGSGARAYRIALGQAEAETKAMQDHQLAMIPIMREQAEMELGIREKAFALEIEQSKQMNLLSQKLYSAPQPVLMPAQATSEGPGSKNLVYLGLAILAYFLFLRKK